MLRSYLKKIYEIIQRGDAREETYYSTLEKLLQEYSESINKKDIRITTLPKQTEAGNPDFRVWEIIFYKGFWSHIFQENPKTLYHV